MQGDTGDAVLIPGLGRSLGEGNRNPLAWKIPWTEEPSRLQSVRVQSQTRLSPNAHMQFLEQSGPPGGLGAGLRKNHLQSLKNTWMQMDHLTVDC